MAVLEAVGNKINCQQCNKEITVSPIRLKSKTITCSRKCSRKLRLKNRKNDESCPVCGSSFHLKPFHKKRFKGPFTCSRKCRGKLLESYYSGELNPNFKYSSNIELLFAERLQSIKCRSNEKNLKFDLDLPYMIELYNKQEGLCFYTKIPMKLGSSNFSTKGQADLDTLSVDKIIPENGYTKGNIVYCCSAINKLKGNASVEELNYFVQMLRLHYGK